MVTNLANFITVGSALGRFPNIGACRAVVTVVAVFVVIAEEKFM